MSLFTLALTLFLIINPLGNMKLFMSLVEAISPERRKFVVMRELLFALLAMFFFSLLGERIAWAFSFTNTTVLIAAGLILFLTALRILFPKELHLPKVHGEEHFLVPIAIPIVASPALLATIMLFAQAEELMWPLHFAILIAWAVSATLFLHSAKVMKVLGHNGLLAIERLMGMVLVLIAVQRFMDGITSFIAHIG
jgi:multiple antibiotic resistance protein